jgi:hypothetical protein
MEEPGGVGGVGAALAVVAEEHGAATIAAGYQGAP